MKNKSFFLVFLISFLANANVRMPLLFSDGMVLQRDKEIPVWGWADANEKIVVSFHNQKKTAKADASGKWMLKLDAEKAGGPFKLIIEGKNKISISNVLVGEVWICSGQSNMEFQVSKAMNFKEEIKDAEFPMIHHFAVAQDMASIPKDDLKAGNWAVCSKETVGDFSAVGYYFAKKIYSELKIPIGIINTSWGGTCVETWTSQDAFSNSDEFKDMIAGMPVIDIDSLTKKQMEIITNKIEKNQGNAVSIKEETLYQELDFNDSRWPEMKAPELWENQELSNLDGVVWMRKTIIVSKEDANKKAILELAKIDDQDTTYINGVLIGSTKRYDEKRVYEVPEGVLKEGENVIAVRIFDYSGGGGIWGEASDLKLTLQNSIIPLSGQWKFNVVAIRSEVSPNSYPSLLFNAMINPLIPYTFQGVLWYQGEANVNRAFQYKKAFPLMITDWRTKWKQGDFPFYFVQLATFDEFGGNSNKGSKWAELREAQTQTLQLSNTGMAVTTDIGNPTDIHPINKQDVGKRLAAIALNQVYKQKVVFQGPAFKSQEVKGNQIILTFENVNGGLVSSDKNNSLNGFEIAGADKVFYSATAKIKDKKVILSSENVPSPVAIRYGWADDASDCNLYNKEGFPAVPFRTDNWEQITSTVKYSFK